MFQNLTFYTFAYLGSMGGKSRSNGESTLTKAKKRKNLKDDSRQTIRQKRKWTGKKEMMVSFTEKPSNHKKMAAGNVIKRKGSLSEQNGETPTETNSSILIKLKEKEERENLVLWRHPLTTLQYFSFEAAFLLKNNGLKLWHHRQYVLLAAIVSAVTLLAYHSKGSHQKYVQFLQSKFIWCSYWIGLGVLSSVGFGTGLHTFILYLPHSVLDLLQDATKKVKLSNKGRKVSVVQHLLIPEDLEVIQHQGPHIASVTLAAYECGSLDFPEPPYPDEIICPENGIEKKAITVWAIMSKVRLEAFMWGAGTALGELPPYFMAKASRLSGYDPDEDHEDFDQLLQQNSVHSNDQSLLDRAKIVVEKLVEKVGFFGILACASIPNPLFDLAGITCGHFLVPFWTFFGATLIGKAIIKMHIQKLFVIIAFNEEMLAKAVDLIRFVPYVGQYLQAPFKEFLVKQKAKLHKRAHSENSWLAWIFEKFVICMIAYFVVSIINSLAQSYHKRFNKNKSSSSQLKIAKD